MVGASAFVATVSGADDGARHEAAGTKNVARGGLANLVGAGYSGVASFVTTVIVARIATPQDAGFYFSAVALVLIAAALVELGVPVGYVYFLARYRGLERTDGLRGILTAGAAPMLSLGVIVAAVGVVFREPLGTLLLGDEADSRAMIMTIVAGSVLLAIVADSALSATRGFGVMRPTVVADKFVNPTIQLAALLLLSVVGWTGGEELVWTRALGFAAVAVIGTVWLTRLLRRYPRPLGESLRDAWTPEGATTRAFWKYAGPRAVGQIAQVGVQRVDIVLVALWLSPSEAAVYAAATRFLIFGQLAANAIGTAVQPRFSNLTARGEMSALQDLYRTSTAWVMFATWPFYLTFIVHADLLMDVFGEVYASGASVLRILSAAMLVATACGAVDAVLLMAGRSTWTMINAWVALVVNLGLNIWLIPRLGILGATIAWVAAILVNNVVPLIQVLRGLHVHPFDRITMLAALAPVLLFGVGPCIVAQLGGGLVGGIASLTVAAAIYCPLLWRWRRPLGLVGLFRRNGRGKS
ncbi:MAG: polysaccharide biosynthesis C-terminal domain-containing protein [Microbacterium sp.]|uniref:lipopolysaccharide biosynthesis protein n=1 Tax=Microbacterium sp. TaxID=51671 RepID=UPI0039E25957